MFFTKPFNLCVTFNGEKYLFKDVFRCGISFVDGEFFFVVRSKFHQKDYSDRFLIDDVNHITKIEFWRTKGGDNK